MESISEETWDVVLSGTGLSQSLLALALSRSGRKVLHIDKNDYYGGAEAALSLQEAGDWVVNVQKDDKQTTFRHPFVHKKEHLSGAASNESSKLGFSRAYSLSLSPQLIYARSNILPALVSSKVYRQLEFLAVGSWWIYNRDENSEADSLRRIPGGREDVFAEKSIDLRSTRALMKFLKLAADSEAHNRILEDWGQKPFPEFLESHFSIPNRLQPPLLALTLSPNPPAETLTSYALPRIHRHLTSTGIFGPGFGSVIPKWGGLAEIAQVACRAGAVGGGVYVLKKGFAKDKNLDKQNPEGDMTDVDTASQILTVRLDDGEEVKAHWIVGSKDNLPSRAEKYPGTQALQVARSITVVSSPLSQLFPPPGEGAPPSAGAVIVYPTGSLKAEFEGEAASDLTTGLAPVYLMAHSSDTGECPAGQCIIYAHTILSCLSSQNTHFLLRNAVQRLLTYIHEETTGEILWELHYDQEYTPPATADNWDKNIKTIDDRILQLPDVVPGFSLEEDVLKHVRAAYRRIVGGEESAFLVFEERDGTGDEDDDGGDDI